MPRDLTALLTPKSVAIIGASRSAEKVGGIVLQNIIDSHFSGQIYPVNPNSQIINNLRCYPSVASLPQVPDLAIVILPAQKVFETLTELGDKGVKNVVVISAGFKEIGSDGAKLEEDLIAISQKYQLNLIGPNCLGFVNNFLPINATFGQAATDLGNLRFISQSGAIAAGIFDWCKSSGVGFSEFITLGNKAILNENDFLTYFQNQTQHPLMQPTSKGLSNVRPIGMYLESISNGPEFLKLVSSISLNDPIFILKPGKTQAAAKAMQSHTGAIAGADNILEAVLKQAGVIRCHTLEDFFDLSKAFAWENPPIGPAVAIISNAGGPAVISADAIIEAGLQLAQIDDQTQASLEKILPRSASVANPVDILGDALAERFSQAAEIVLQTNLAQTLLVILTPQVMTQVEQTAEVLGNLSQKYQTPIYCSFIGGNLVAEGETILNKYKIPSFRFPERAISAIGAAWSFKKMQLKNQAANPTAVLAIYPEMEKINHIINRAVQNGQKTLDNFDSNEIMTTSGILTPLTQIAASLEEAKTFANSNGYPVVLKLSSAGLLHKRAIGGVITDISHEPSLETAWDKLERVISEQNQTLQSQIKIQIQKHILNGVEVIVGVKSDPTFGKVMMFGAGGSLTELIADRNLHLLPLDYQQAKNLITQSKIFQAHTNQVNEPTIAWEKLANLMVQLAKIAQDTPEISEIEINPVIVTLNNVWAVDPKVILTSGETPQKVSPKFKVATTINQQILASTFHFFEFQTEQPFIFEAGQYISVKVSPERINCYSIASHQETDRFNLLVDTKPGGPGSKFFDNLKVGDKIAYLGPFGTFHLNLNDGAKSLLFLATGSGCSPLRCMIDTALKDHRLKIPITLYLGLNYPQDLFWQEYFQKLSQDFPNFQFKVAIFLPDSAWQGHKGFITDLVRTDYPDAKECAAYLCGNKAMIADSTKLLLEHGCPNNRIYTEKY